jgi:hypothetical protein
MKSITTYKILTSARLHIGASQAINVFSTSTLLAMFAQLQALGPLTRSRRRSNWVLPAELADAVMSALGCHFECLGDKGVSILADMYTAALSAVMATALCYYSIQSPKHSHRARAVQTMLAHKGRW